MVEIIVEYDKPKIEQGVFASAASLKLDLRRFSKEWLPEVYFEKVPIYGNVVRAIFGTPEFSGLFRMGVLDENEETALISIKLDPFDDRGIPREKAEKVLKEIVEKCSKKNEWLRIVSTYKNGKRAALS
jgi:hypothetical protein